MRREREYCQAPALNPRYPDVQADYSHLLLIQRRFNEANLVVRAVDAVQPDAIELVACNVTGVALDPAGVPFFYVVFNLP